MFAAGAASAVCLALAGAAVCATWQDKKVEARPEIHGVVLEPGINQPVPDAEVSLIRFPDQGQRIISPVTLSKPLLTGKTDARGAFSLPLEQLGDYYLAVKKDGYRTLSGPSARGLSSSAQFTLNGENPSRDLRLFLVRPGQLTGRVVDEETGKPIENFQVFPRYRVCFRGGCAFVPAGSATTDAEGRFVASDLTPGDYLVVINPRLTGKERILTQFSDDDLKAVDQDFRNTYWPGGRDQDSAYPITLMSGGSANVGQLALRKMPLYRARVSFSAPSCQPGDTVRVTDRMIDIGSVPCGKDVLIRGFSPGSSRLVVWVDKRNRDTREKASVPFVVTDKNIEIFVPLTRGVDLEGKFVAAEGAGTPDVSKVRLRLQSTETAPFLDEQPDPPDAAGKFRILNVPFVKQQLLVTGLSAANYIKEVRYNGIPAPDGVLPLDKDAAVHSVVVVVDDKPAVLTGTVTSGDRPVSQPFVALVKWPPSAEGIRFSASYATGDDKGKFQFAGLAPGEYRIVAVSPAAQSKLDEPNVLERLMANAKKITLGASGFQNVNVESIEP